MSECMKAQAARKEDKPFGVLLYYIAVVQGLNHPFKISVMKSVAPVAQR